MSESNEKPDFSNLQINLNGSPQKIDGFKFNSGEKEDSGKVWLMFDITDAKNGHCQSVEIEFAGLMKVWNQIVGMSENLKDFGKDLQDLGQEFMSRFQRGYSAFTSDLPGKSDKKPDS
jgi:hypothetical protein